MEVGITAGHARGGRVGEGRGTAGRDHAPFRLRHFREPRADRRHQFVEMDVLLRGGVDGRPHLGQHEGPADDGEGAARVDQRAHADRCVQVLAGPQLCTDGEGRAGLGCRRHGAGIGAKERRRGDLVAYLVVALLFPERF